jgi:2'-5' RNA ligase
MRLFFALWPPPETARALGEWARKVQRQTGGRVTVEETTHLTLAFLGDVDPDKALAAARPLRGVPFELAIDTANYWRHNRILWVGPQETPPQLTALVAPLHAGLRAQGIALEERPFAAHITMIRKAAQPTSLPALPKLAWPATEFVLVRSTPMQAGSRYEVVERLPLRAHQG